MLILVFFAVIGALAWVIARRVSPQFLQYVVLICGYLAPFVVFRPASLIDVIISILAYGVGMLRMYAFIR